MGIHDRLRFRDMLRIKRSVQAMFSQAPVQVMSDVCSQYVGQERASLD